MDFWFAPILPSECGETSRGKLISKEEYLNWKPAQTLQYITSNLELQDLNPGPEINRNYVYVSKECKIRGNDAEELFLNIAKQKNYRQTHIKDWKNYDYFHHVDAMLEIPEQSSKKEIGERQEIWIDIKSLRSLRRGWKPQSEYMWVELNSNGWLFGGKSTVIAQQIDNLTFALFDREALKKFVLEKVDVKRNIVKNAEECLYRVYLRESSNKNGSRSFTCALSLIETKEAFEKAGCEVWSLQA